MTNSATVGVAVQPTGAGSATAVIDRVRLNGGSLSALLVAGSTTTGNVTATVRDSVMSGASGVGLAVFNSNTGATRAMIDRSVIVNNVTGLSVGEAAKATARIGRSTVSGNTTGLNGGTIESYGNNQVNGNGTDGAPSSTIDPI